MATTTICPFTSANSLLRRQLLLRRFLSSSPPRTRQLNVPLSHSHWLRRWDSDHLLRPRRRCSPLLAFPKRPPETVDYRLNPSDDDDDELDFGTSRSSGNSTMRKIVDRLKKFGYVDTVDPPRDSQTLLPSRGSVEDIFYAEDGGAFPNPRGGVSASLDDEPVRFPWEKPVNEGDDDNKRKKRSKTAVAELTLPEGELRRLRRMAMRITSKVKIGGAGVTKEVVDLIHKNWRMEEVVRIKCEGPPALNMKRMHEILERKTGGLVIWRSGTSISLYRGVTYEVSQPVTKQYRSNEINSFSEATYSPANPIETVENAPAAPAEKKGVNSSPEPKYEHEVDKLLDGLGPRYEDWPGCDPLPVDADLLPGTVPGFGPPFRLLPYGVRSSLGRKEGTALRRLARVLPPHFALGRSRQHEGLAAAMLKLWERSSIVKIALKRGVQVTSSERMAEDIKRLTGGTLLSRNKDYLVFYRGKDFLSAEVAEALLERERLAKALQDAEEQARLIASSAVVSNVETVEEPSTAGTLGETLEADARWAKKLDEEHKGKMMRAAELERHAVLVRKIERKLFIAERKLGKAGKALAKAEESLKPAERTEPESITDEERFMLHKLGLKMKAFLLLGRRGVFDGTVENMHLHWKYRELVKIIMKAKNFAEVKNVALSLEAESGGVLISVDKISKGYAIIVFRGKDYQRPATLRPKNLLTKRKALARSIELQRREALNQHISNLHKKVEQLKSELEQMENVKDQGDDNLYARLDSAYLTEDEDTEDESEEAYLTSFDGVVGLENDEDEHVNIYAADEDSNFASDDEKGDEDEKKDGSTNCN